MSVKVEQSLVLSLIVGQLKTFGFYALAKQVTEQVGVNGEPSNIIMDSLAANSNLTALIGKASATESAGFNPLGGVQDFKDGDHLVFGTQRAGKPNPNYKNWFNTQHRGSARACAFSQDGSFIATGSEDTSLKVLDATILASRDSSSDEKKVIKTLYDHTAAVNEVAFHPNGAVLASCSDDCNIKFYDLHKQNSKKGFRYLADAYPVRSISFHPSGEYILSGTDHHAVRLYDIHSMKVYTPSGKDDFHAGPITRVRYAPNGSTFASCSLDGTIKIYDTVTSKCINTIAKAHDGASVVGITFSKSCAYLLSTGLDSKGKLWDMGSGKVLCTYEGALQKVVSLADMQFDQAPMVFSHNEDYVIGVDAKTNSIIIWDSQTGDIFRKIKGGLDGVVTLGMHDAPIHQIAASPTDPGFVSVGDDCRARYWGVQH
ncbi:cleavage stimulation factor, 3' pre-RNA, subunit 1 [Kappamyces sp. JEL0829]|nr:cleavage stimulation factor, 3' pre-RNA, subunit 1 [Kappamyces sp. JEL0829]